MLFLEKTSQVDQQPGATTSVQCVFSSLDYHVVNVSTCIMIMLRSVNRDLTLLFHNRSVSEKLYAHSGTLVKNMTSAKSDEFRYFVLKKAL